MKPSQFLTAIAIAAFACGCFHLETATTRDFQTYHMVGQNGDPATHIIASNWGWYIFDKYPVVCGNPDPDAFLPCTFFSDVGMRTLQDRITRHASKAKLDVVDLSAFRDSTCMLPIPYFGTTLPLGIVWKKECRMSAILAKPAPGKIDEIPNETNRRKLTREMNRLLNALPDADGETKTN